MAKILIVTVPIRGHIYPALPIARQLINNGHSVAWYTGKKYRDIVETIGCSFCPINAAQDYDDSKLDETFPGRAGLQGIPRMKFDITHMFLDRAAGQYEDLQKILEDFPADLILSDNASLGPYFLKVQGGPKWVFYGIIPLSLSSLDTAPFGMGLFPAKSFPGRLRNRFLYWLGYRLLYRKLIVCSNAIRAQFSLPPEKRFVYHAAIYASDLFLQATVPSFEYPRRDLPDSVKFIGPLLPNPKNDFISTDWWNDLSSGKTVIHVTQGTLALDLNDLLIPVIKALADEDVLVVATTGDKPVNSLGLADLPQNLRLEKFIPYHQLLPHVDIMITNGGYGGVQFALAHGIPLIAAGNTEEKREVCTRVAWSGAGINLKTKRPSPKKILKAVKKILADPKYRNNARRIQTEMAKYNAVSQAVSLIEDLVNPTSTVKKSREENIISNK